jgi:hypothetical protein
MSDSPIDSNYTYYAYIGTLVDHNETDSTDKTKYKWSRVEGAQGPQGE